MDFEGELDMLAWCREVVGSRHTEECDSGGESGFENYLGGRIDKAW